ncbi:MAG TPA: cellulose biosynthesis protein BcsQ [Acidobacteriaceae bacterium]|nr:cellulose biosynthesis protein BcsQ [Acidobacteriaceae bacterium]
MPDPNTQGPNIANENTEPPEDVATLYSWANLHGAKYRDFSAARAQARDAARQRVEEAAAAERRRQEEEAERLRQEEAQRAAREAAEAAEAARQAEAERLAELARQAEIERQAVLAAQEAQRQAAQQRAWQSGHASSGAWEPSTVFPVVAEAAPGFSLERPSLERLGSERPSPERHTPPAASVARVIETPHPHNEMKPFSAPAAAPASFPSYAEPPSFFSPPAVEELPPSWFTPTPERETESLRPSWLAPEIPSVAPAPVAPPVAPPAPQRPVPMYVQPVGHTPAPQQTAPAPPLVASPQLSPYMAEGGQYGGGNRWFALKSVFDPQSAPAEQPAAPQPAQMPVLAVFSLAGGVGKTSIVAALGRALSARGERLLLVDTTAYGLLPFFFGARDQRPSQLRTFTPPGAGLEAPVQLITLDPETPPAELTSAAGMASSAGSAERQQEWLPAEITRLGRVAHRVLIDLPSASGSTTRRILRLNPTILVPVVADMNSVVSVGAIESFFRHNGSAGQRAGDRQIQPYYLLNQFDPSLPLHLDVREILREQIGDRLLPFTLRRSPAVSEALAEGMTVIDYAPSTPLAEDYVSLAGWVRSLAAPAAQANRGVRWSER